MVKGKALVGPILGVIGATLLTIAGFIGFGAMATLQVLLSTYGLTWADIGLDPSLLTVNAILTLIWGLVGLIGAILGLVGKKIGVYLMLIFGLVATVGLFVPIGTISLIIPIPITLNSSLFIVDPILLFIGGLLGLLLKEE